MSKKLFFVVILITFLANTLATLQPTPKTAPEISMVDYEGTLVPEKFSFHRVLKFFNGAGGKFFGSIAKSEIASNVAGWAQNNENPFKINWKKFVKKHNINMNEFIIPEDGYKTFNDFFTRQLKPGARVVDQTPGGIVSPADSKCTFVQDISKKDIFIIKNSKWSLTRMLMSQNLAERYDGGTLISFRLAPEDYHRYHFPFDTTPGFSKPISGKYNSVNPYVFKHGDDPLGENARSIIVLQSEEFGDPLCIIVGAMGVGKIVETYTPSVPYKKGDEMGYFKFGASTVCLLFKKGIIKPSQKKFLSNSKDMIETAVKQGQLIALKTSSETEESVEPAEQKQPVEKKSFFDFARLTEPLTTITHFFSGSTPVK